MKIIEKIKAHPIMAGALIIGGGITFIVLSGWFSGGSSGSVEYVDSGPTDAEIASSTQIALATIAANAQSSQASAELQAAKWGYDLEELRTEFDYELGLQQLNAGREISLASLNAQIGASNQSAALQSQSIVSSENMYKYGVSADLESQRLDNAFMSSIIDALKPAPAPTNTVVTAPEAPASPPVSMWQDYLNKNPDVYAEAIQERGLGTFEALGISSLEEFGAWHYSSYGAAEGRQV